MKPSVNYLKDYKEPQFYIKETYLDFIVFEDYIEVKSKLVIYRNKNVENSTDLTLDGENLITKEIKLNGVKLTEQDYTIQKDTLTIHNIKADEFICETTVHINPFSNTSLMGIYISKSCLCSQCEPEGFRRITWFLDRPDVMSVWQVSITADANKYSAILSNGNMIKEEKLNDNQVKKTFHDICPKPSYLFAFVVGNFDVCSSVFTTKSGRKVDIHVYVEKGKQSQGWFALESLRKSMKWDEDTYNLEYELDVFSIVAVSDFNFGAMENKSLNIFNDAYVLAIPEIATDDDYFNIESIVAHEYFHNFTGDRITCKNWFQLTLKEGLTVYRDHKFSESLHNKDIVRINEVEILRIAQFAEDASPLCHPIRPQSYIEMNNFYTPTVYEKGSEVIRMIETIIGEDTFKKGIDIYFENFDGMAVTCDDFVWSMEQAAGISLEKFKKWYSQSGTPNVFVDIKNTANTMNLSFKQITYPTADQEKKEPLVIPLKMALVNSNTGKLDDIIIDGKNYGKEYTFTLENTEHNLTLDSTSQNHIISLNRYFSAPILLHIDYKKDDLISIIKYEIDGFARYEALQVFLKQNMVNVINQDIKGNQLKEDDIIDILDIYETILQEYKNNTHLVSAMLRIPRYQSFEVIYKTDFPLDNIYNVTLFLENAIAHRFYDKFRSIFNELTDKEDEFSATMMGIRSLKNRCLYYIAKVDATIVEEYYNNTKSMTKKMGALLAIKDNVNHPIHKTLLDDFYESYKGYNTVINKWLSLQGSISDPDVSLTDTLDNIKEIMKSAKFSINNPNNVRSLIGSFVANYKYFHDISGKGYSFLGNIILELDKINPSVAAGLAKSFSKLRLHTKLRQSLILYTVKNIMSNQSISKGLYEILSRISIQK